jgi:PTH1 family peptidyl-tRNA hydrolase
VDSTPPTTLVVGLGNPGPEYEGTRHNVGFDVVGWLARMMGDRPFLKRGRSLVARGAVEGASGERTVLLARPVTFMNRSGRALRDLLAEQTRDAAVLVVCDEYQLPLGRLRCRRHGSSGGHKGLGSILDLVPDRDIPRLRIGIGDPGRAPAEEFVLRPFTRGERPKIDAAIDRAGGHLHDWLAHGDLDRLIRACNAPE